MEPQPPGSYIRFDKVEVHLADRLVLVDGEPAALGSRAFAVLTTLIEHRDRAVSKSELLDAVWRGLVVEENNLQVQISALRRLLGPQTIATIPGRGYRFMAKIEGDQAPAARADAHGTGAPPGPTQADWTRGNLPASLPELYGRRADLDAVKTLVTHRPLVTLVGASGIGKTRLAQSVAFEMRESFADGAWIIELASLNDPGLIAATVAQALRISLPNLRAAEQELISALQSQRLLLVFDNCEHLVEAISELAFKIARQAPAVRLLATSQELLKVPDEYVYRLAPLAVPVGGQMSGAAEFGAVQLFVERAHAADARFELRDANVSAVVDICGRLDGIPLAIELAAARIPLLGVLGVQERLGERFRLLTGGSRIAAHRHQTLRAALEWSHGLLSAGERTVYRRLGVFVGGFSIESAQDLAGDESLDQWAVLEHLSALVDKSLVLAEGEPRPRYRLLESTREHALEQLALAGETDAWIRRHAEVTRHAIDQAVRQRDVELLTTELGNVRAAFAWARSDGGDPVVAVALATSPSVVLAVEGAVTEALDRLLSVEALVTDAIPPVLAAQYWQWLGRLGIDGRLPNSRCIALLRRAEAMFRQQGNRRHLHGCMRHLAEAMLESGDVDGARAALDEAASMEDDAWPLADRMRRLRVEALLHELRGHLRESLETAARALRMAEQGCIERYVLVLLADMARVHLEIGDSQEAVTRYRALAERARQWPNSGLTLCYALSGLVAALTTRGELAAAGEVAREAVALLRRSGILLARADILACLMARLAQFEVAAHLLGAADRFRDSCESERDPVERRSRDDTLALLQASCAPQDVRRWLAFGARASEDVLAQALQSGTSQGYRNSASMSASGSSTSLSSQ